MTTINLRSTSNLTEYVKTCDRMETHAKQLKELQKREKQLRAEVLEEIGDRREIAVRGQVRILQRSDLVSVSRSAEESTVCEYLTAQGISGPKERSAIWLPPATFSKLVRDGLMPAEFCETKKEPIVIVT